MRIHALPEAVVERARASAGVDEFHELRDEAVGAPLRCCLRRAGEGEAVVLFRYSPTAGTGPYAELGPVFVHAEPCGGLDRDDVFPEAFRHSPRVFRAYGPEGRIEGGRVVEVGSLDAELARMLDDPAVVEVQVRSASHGCFLFAVTPG
ncbi:DUF1203 domain-containing protein [Saccharothrix violaceirubra]|uniref:DUF1203 domain-containing protein n=1 Tax=Saccharothrix violaceirubra TaxID=413306 RepID=A0A7W7T981_9PSEU|nr:DUF1203 domain-containing protein [Saccharothrix violaceirubra]MBB4968879.1 hypothetical protein [Saccharothrix violaceirubra]